MTVDQLIEKVISIPGSVNFTDVIETIEATYSYTPTRFGNGIGNNVLINEAGTNEGSCKIFAFGLLNNFDEQQALACFGKYYREDVLNHPDGDDHLNIRNFILHGWKGIVFEGKALSS